MSTISAIENIFNQKNISEELRDLIFSYIDREHPLITISYNPRFLTHFPHLRLVFKKNLYSACFHNLVNFKKINCDTSKIMAYLNKKKDWFRSAIEDNQELIDEANECKTIFLIHLCSLSET